MGLEKPYRTIVDLQAKAGAARIVVAAKRHGLRHGRWPEEISAMDADLLPAVPVDPFTGDTLAYALREGEPLVWSAGEDKDYDGFERSQGRHIWVPTPELEARLIKRPEIDGDWVIYPPTQED